MTATAERLHGLGRRRRLGLAALSGAVAALGLAPFNLPLLSLAGFAGLLLALMPCARPGRGFLVGLAGGAGYFAVALHWIVEPFFVDPWRHGWMAPFALLFMAAGLALFWAVAAAFSVRLSRPGPARAALWAVAMALAEWLRATVLTGFPWAHPGHVWIGSPLMTLAAFTGPHGLTLLTLAVAAGIALALWARRWLLVLPVSALALLFGLAALVPPAPGPAPGATVVRLVQPNAPQHLKWLPEMIPVFFQRALDLTAAAPESGPAPALVIWPETTLPVLLRNSEPWRGAIAEAAGGAEVILGGQRLEQGEVRNALYHLDAEGAVAAIYDKHHLVPFGEYIPLTGMARAMGLRGLAEAAGPGYAPGPGPDLLDLGGFGQVFPMICYETIFPTYIGQVERPDWMVQITNDAWFGEFSGPYQHLELAQLRAVEQGLPLLRAANTGVSAVIDARGQVLASLPLGQHGALDAALPLALPPTPYARSGDWPVLVLLLLACAGLAALGRKNPIDPGADSA